MLIGIRLRKRKTETNQTDLSLVQQLPSAEESKSLTKALEESVAKARTDPTSAEADKLTSSLHASTESEEQNEAHEAKQRKVRSPRAVGKQQKQKTLDEIHSSLSSDALETETSAQSMSTPKLKRAKSPPNLNTHRSRRDNDRQRSPRSPRKERVGSPNRQADASDHQSRRERAGSPVRQADAYDHQRSHRKERTGSPNRQADASRSYHKERDGMSKTKSFNRDHGDVHKDIANEDKPKHRQKEEKSRLQRRPATEDDHRCADKSPPQLNKHKTTRM